MGQGFRKIDSLVLDGPRAFDEDELEKMEIPQEKRLTLSQMADMFGVEETVLRERLEQSRKQPDIYG